MPQVMKAPPPPKKKGRRWGGRWRDMEKGGGRGDFVPSEEINPHVRQKDHADLLMVGQIQRK